MILTFYYSGLIHGSSPAAAEGETETFTEYNYVQHGDQAYFHQNI